MDPNNNQNLGQPSVPTSPIAQSTVQPKVHSSFPKWLLIIFGLIIVLGFVGGAYLLGVKQKNSISQISSKEIKASPSQIATLTPDPASNAAVATANWQIYTNAKYAYSVKYPTGLTSQEVNTYYHYVEFTSAAGVLPSFLVSVVPDTFVVKDVAAYNYMSSDWIANISNVAIGQSKTMDEAATFTRLKDMTIAGQDAVAIKVVATGYKQLRVYGKKNGYIYMLSNYYQSDDELANFTLFASSFKFTK